jgi:hypothetical protein
MIFVLKCARKCGLGFRVASRHADVTAILRDKRFGKDFIGRITRRSGPQILEEPVYRSMSHWMLQLDPPDHERLRSRVVRAFTARRVEDMRRSPVSSGSTARLYANASRVGWSRRFMAHANRASDGSIRSSNICASA